MTEYRAGESPVSGATAGYVPPAHEVAELCEDARRTRDEIVKRYPHFREAADEAMEAFRQVARGFLVAVEAGDARSAERCEEAMQELDQDLIWMEYGSLPEQYRGT